MNWNKLIPVACAVLGIGNFLLATEAWQVVSANVWLAAAMIMIYRSHQIKYKVKPYINPDNNRKGWIIIHNDKHEDPYSADGKKFTIYYNFSQAEDHCNHLNGDSKVWGIVSMNDWQLFKEFMAGRG